MDSGFYAACAGLRAKTQALEVVANNLANLTMTGYSSSQVDKRKVGKLAIAIQVAFQELGVFPASNTAIPLDPNEPVPFNTVQAIENAERTAALGRIAPSPKGILGASENGDLSSLRQELEDALALEIQRNEVAVSAGPDGLIVSLREIGSFDSGSAQIRASSLSAFSRIAWLLADRKYRVRIEGHTNNRPIHNTKFSDNWELSTGRASELVRLLIVKYGFAPERLSAAGYAEYHPVTDNGSAEGRAQNRRVDVVILGKISNAKGHVLTASPCRAVGDHADLAVGSQPSRGAKASCCHRSNQCALGVYFELVSSVWCGSSTIFLVSAGTVKWKEVCGPSAKTVPRNCVPRSETA
ncbi:MAG TPA: OmpA family protein [Terriglobales bacterium]|nr:OmpA family protein [Terriglobales bacterium]